MVETRLQHALRGNPDWIPAKRLVELLLAAGLPTRNAAQAAVTYGFEQGQIERMGTRCNYSYRLVSGGRNAVADAKERAARQYVPNGRVRRVEATPAIAYSGPAFDSGVLAPLITAPDPEVMPEEVANIIESLHQRMYRERIGVE
ncbi:MAG: hypothetical protein NVV60_01580 [Luteimonas sp.]|nr:hypothetical protein [Luteimonas sp.]